MVCPACGLRYNNIVRAVKKKSIWKFSVQSHPDYYIGKNYKLPEVHSPLPATFFYIGCCTVWAPSSVFLILVLAIYIHELRLVEELP